MGEAPQPSIVIGGSEPWPELRSVPYLLHPQAVALDAEIPCVGPGRSPQRMR